MSKKVQIILTLIVFIFFIIEMIFTNEPVYQGSYLWIRSATMNVQNSSSTQSIQPDIVAMRFDKEGLVGTAVSSDGYLLVTSDGGDSWKPEPQIPLKPGELITSIMISEKNSTFIVGIGIENSPYTAILEKKSNMAWERVEEGDYGGIAAASNNNNFFVGGNGLLVSRKDNDKEEEWQFNSMASCKGKMLTAITASNNEIYLVGEEATIAHSIDNGLSWEYQTIPDNKNTLYTIDSTSKAIFVAGSETFLRLPKNETQWKKIVIPAKSMIFSLYLSEKEETLEGFAGGGFINEFQPLLLHTNDGENWSKEQLPINFGSIVAIAKGRKGYFAATNTGLILFRKKVLN